MGSICQIEKYGLGDSGDRKLLSKIIIEVCLFFWPSYQKRFFYVFSKGIMILFDHPIHPEIKIK